MHASALRLRHHPHDFRSRARCHLPTVVANAAVLGDGARLQPDHRQARHVAHLRAREAPGWPRACVRHLPAHDPDHRLCASLRARDGDLAHEHPRHQRRWPDGPPRVLRLVPPRPRQAGRALLEVRDAVRLQRGQGGAARHHRGLEPLRHGGLLPVAHARARGDAARRRRRAGELPRAVRRRVAVEVRGALSAGRGHREQAGHRAEEADDAPPAGGDAHRRADREPRRAHRRERGAPPPRGACRGRARGGGGGGLGPRDHHGRPRARHERDGRRAGLGRAAGAALAMVGLGAVRGAALHQARGVRGDERCRLRMRAPRACIGVHVNCYAHVA
mmetsp:Transcript_36596/g.92754  ORF Transcript_36596/g.92754 Transcript_36596/m.92754 type:complete len:332 (+) Transcript_36596:329-1324(+)